MRKMWHAASRYFSGRRRREQKTRWHGLIKRWEERKGMMLEKMAGILVGSNENNIKDMKSVKNMPEKWYGDMGRREIRSPSWILRGAPFKCLKKKDGYHQTTLGYKIKDINWWNLTIEKGKKTRVMGNDWKERKWCEMPSQHELALERRRWM